MMYTMMPQQETTKRVKHNISSFMSLLTLIESRLANVENKTNVIDSVDAITFRDNSTEVKSTTEWLSGITTDLFEKTDAVQQDNQQLHATITTLQQNCAEIQESIASLTQKVNKLSSTRPSQKSNQTDSEFSIIAAATNSNTTRLQRVIRQQQGQMDPILSGLPENASFIDPLPLVKAVLGFISVELQPNDIINARFMRKKPGLDNRNRAG